VSRNDRQREVAYQGLKNKYLSCLQELITSREGLLSTAHMLWSWDFWLCFWDDRELNLLSRVVHFGLGRLFFVMNLKHWRFGWVESLAVVGTEYITSLNVVDHCALDSTVLMFFSLVAPCIAFWSRDKYLILVFIVFVS